MPHAHSASLTPRAIVLGVLIGGITCCQNVYFALKYGWTTTGNITACILGFGASQMLPGSRLTPAENVVLMTTAVATTSVIAAGSLPFAIFAMSEAVRASNNLAGDLPSDTMDFDLPRLLAYSASVAFIGFFVATPLRRQFVLNKPLTFPYAVAGARAIQALHATLAKGVEPHPLSSVTASAENSRTRAAGSPPASVAAPSAPTPPTRPIELFALLWALVPSMVWSGLTWLVTGLEHLPIFGTAAMEQYEWKLNLAPANFGQGLIIPSRFVLSQLLGAAISSGVLLPIAVAHKGEWYPSTATGFQGKDAYYYLPAIIVISVDSIYQLLKLTAASASTLGARRQFGSQPPLLDAEARSDGIENGTEPARLPAKASWLGGAEDDPMPVWMWVGGSLVSAGLAWLAFQLMFGAPAAMLVVALASAPLWAVGITIGVGTTGSNMAAACGKAMIMVFAAWSGEGHIVPTLALGALSIAVISQAIDLVRDYKTALLVGGISPRDLARAQFVGAAVSIFASSASYLLLLHALSVPSDEYPAVVSKGYRALAFVFAGGFDALPRNCLAMSIASAVFAVGLDVLDDVLVGINRRRPPGSAFPDLRMPSVAAMGIGMYLLPGQSFAVLVGLAAKEIWARVDPVACGRLSELVGAGMMAGDGLGGVLQIVLDLCVPPDWQHPSITW